MKKSEKKYYTSLKPFAVNEVMETYFYNGQMIQFTRPKTKREMIRKRLLANY